MKCGSLNNGRGYWNFSSTFMEHMNSIWTEMDIIFNHEIEFYVK